MQEEAVPLIGWERFGDPGKDAQKMCFEVVNCHFRGIASVASWWYKFKGKVVLVPDVFLHVVRDFVVNHMFFGDTPVCCRHLTNAP